MELAELLRILPHVDIPYATGDFHLDGVFVAVRFLWQVAVLAGTAAVATQLVGEQRSEEATRAQMAVLDEATGLYSRSYFLRALGAEIRRAQPDERPLHIVLLDIDRFGDYNRKFGISQGDQLLSGIAAAITATVGEAGDVLVTTNVAARYGGEEFVILLAEDATVSGAPQPDDAMRLAEHLRRAIASVSVKGAGATVSVGVASFPADGRVADELLDAADAALYSAVEGGGDRVVAASDFPEPDNDDLYSDALEV
jgi:diguanylate cyclase (GGDEF)-like protein